MQLSIATVLIFDDCLKVYFFLIPCYPAVSQERKSASFSQMLRTDLCIYV